MKISFPKIKTGASNNVWRSPIATKIKPKGCSSCNKK